MDSEDYDDPLFDQAVAFVVDKQKVSTSAVQRQFRIGYNRSGRLIELMELAGVITPPGVNGNREVLVDSSFEVNYEKIDNFKREIEQQRKKDIMKKAEIANSVDEQVRISAISTRKIVIWLKDTGSTSPSGNNVLMLKSSSPFDYLARQQKNKIKPNDSEYSDIIDSYIFSATMQMRTPTSVLCQHGRIERVSIHKLPRIIKQDWQGIWLPHLKPASDLGPWARDFKGTMASDVGYVPEDGGDFLRFLLLAQQIVAQVANYEEAVKWMEVCSDMVGSDGESIGKFVENYGKSPEMALKNISATIKRNQS